MKTLIVYYSMTQNNEALAKQIQARLDCEMLKIETLKKPTTFSIALNRIFGWNPAIRKHTLDLRKYSQFVFIAPIWLGKVAGPMKTFLLQETIYLKKYSFISLCGGLAGQKEKIEAELASIVGMRPQTVCELGVSEIVGEKVAKDPKTISAYRITVPDLEKFQKRIDAFCDAVGGELVKH